MLLIVLYDGVLLVRMTVMMLLSVLYMLGAMNEVSSDGNHTNGNNTTTFSSSLSDGAAANLLSDNDDDIGLCQPTFLVCCHVRVHPFPKG